MQFEDGRFASDMRFPYYAYNSLARWDALNCGSVYIRRHFMEGFSAADMIDMANNSDFDLASSIMYYGASLRGTRSFWKQRCSELVQMVRQIGVPTVFFTLSAADYHWPDLFRILDPNLNLNQCDERTRLDLMHKNPTTVAWFFNKRCDVFMKKFILKVFPVRDFWFRFEWQFRGSPHIHGLLWLDDAPDCSDIDSVNEADRETIVRYFDKLVAAVINQRHIIYPQTNPCRKRFSDISAEERQVDLDRILSSVQRHSRCGSHCLRRKRNQRSGRMVCRYKFPMQLEPVSTLRLDEGSWKFFPKRNDSLLQRYNRFVSQVWRGNTDFSAITSKDAVINYISKYASKGEHASLAFSDVLAAVIDRDSSDTPAATLIRQLLVSSVAERNYSAQEVTHLLMGWPLYHASRTMIILSLRQDWRRVGGDAGGNTNLVEQYASRRGLEDISLFDYAKNYRVASGRVIKRRQECIVRVIPHLKFSEDSTSNQEYYKLQCKLNIPWSGDFLNVKPDDVSWEEFYLAHVDIIDDADEFADEFPILPDEAEFEDEEIDDIRLIVRDPDMTASRIQPGIREVDPLGQRPIDEAFVWNDLSSLGINETQIIEFKRILESSANVNIARSPTVDISHLSARQKEVIQLCERQINDSNCRVKCCIVQGKAGTGKSAVIQSMCKLLDDLDPSSPGKLYRVVAPTGAAAFNVNGSTIHSLFHIPINSQFQPLNGQNLRVFQLQLRDVKFIIIDEYSMVGFRLLHKIHMRLCEARGSSNEKFGGFFIYLFGDLRQLPPVKDTAIYMHPNDDVSRLSLSLVYSFERRIILDINHRQANDQSRFREVLDDIATGNVHESTWRLLMTRRLSVSPANRGNFANAIHLFPTNEKVNEHNESKLSSIGRAVAIIDAEHNNATARQGSDLMASGLQRRLYLSVGCRVMLRRNICTPKGLVNGSLGTVKDIIYHQGRRPPDLPALILVEFDSYAGPFFNQTRAFPLQPTYATWRDQIVECSRKQFSLSLAYALTIHKAQGLTLDKAIVDIGEKEASAGLTYVAFSRVRRLDDLLVLRAFDFSRIATIGRSPQVQARENFLRNMEQHSNYRRIE